MARRSGALRVVEEEGVNFYFIIAGVLVIALLMGYVLFHTRQPKVTQEQHQELQTMAKEHEVHQFNPNINRLKTFINSSLAKGFSPLQINQSLINMGWGQDLINQAFNEIRTQEPTA